MFTLLDNVSRILSSQKPSVKKSVTQPVPKKKQVVVSANVSKKDTQNTKRQAQEILLEAKDEAFKIRQTAQREIEKRETLLEQRLQSLESQRQQIHTAQEAAEKNRRESKDIKKKLLEKLEKTAHLTREEARKLVFEQVEAQSSKGIARIIRESEEKAREEADKKAREIIVDAMRYGATDYVPEYTISTVKLPSEDMKGRIIGKEGRNIRAFEEATGIDVDLDEEGVIRLSSFDAVRREIARASLEKLLRDGRIQPVRIEEVVEQTKKEIEHIMFKEGEKLCHAVGVFNLPRELVALLGRFKYRFSYGQNMIAHTLEETKIGIALAQEVGAEVNIVRLGCLLHDIGKVITDKEGSHVELGVELLKKHNMPQQVIDCVAQHHEDTPFTSVESILVYVSDAISGSRPGARHEDVEGYIKRLADLETIATKQGGVKESFAFQAGRELRVIVKSEEVDDAQMTILAKKIKDEIEEKLTFPGNIRVTAVREVRAVEVAR